MNELDGRSEDFPNREQAMIQYRAAWHAYCETESETERAALEMEMDALQLQIAVGPGPIWKKFIKSLPNYEEFWLRLKETYMAKLVMWKIRDATRRSLDEEGSEMDKDDSKDRLVDH